jgi:hypothetical protein
VAIRARGHGRSGFAVVAALLVLLALLGLAQGAVLMARRELETSILEAGVSARRLTAEMAVSRVERTWAEDSVGEGQAGGSSALRWRTETRALAPEVVLITVTAVSDRLPGSDRRARVAWTLDPLARVAAATAAVESGLGMELAGGAMVAPEPADDVACAADAAALAEASRGWRAHAPLLGEPPGVVPSLGLLPGDSARARLEGLTARVVTPAPVVDMGACSDVPLNWGSPSEPAGPCGARMVALGFEQGLELRGGDGQGVLIGAGDLILTRGARFAGVLLVGGDLRLDEGAVFSGLARVTGGVRLAGGARLAGSPCAAFRALRAAKSLRHPVPISGGRIRPF